MATPRPYHYTRSTVGPIAGGRSLFGAGAAASAAVAAQLAIAKAQAAAAAGQGSAAGALSHGVPLTAAAATAGAASGNLSVTTPGGGAPTWLGSADSWTAAPNSSLTGSGVGWSGTSPGGTGNYTTVVEKWSGACVVDGIWRSGSFVAGKFLMLWGGGHSDYSGNEVYAYGPLNSNTPTWSRITSPTVPGVSGNGGNPRDGSGNPVSRHTYDTLQHSAAAHSMVAFGCPARATDGGNNNTGDMFDYTANPGAVQPWSAGFDSQVPNAGGNGYNRALSAMDESTGMMWILGQGNPAALIRFNPVTKLSTVFTNIDAQTGTVMEDNCKAGFAESLGLFVFPGVGDTIKAIDCRNPSNGQTVFTVSTTGTGPASWKLALEWDAATSRFVAWNDTGKTLYFLTPSSSPYAGGTAWTWSSSTPAGGATPGTILYAGLTAGNGAGTFGRMRLVDDGAQTRGVVLMPNKTDPVCFYRLAAAPKITTVNITSAAATGTHPTTFAVAFKKGDVPSNLVIDAADYQVNVLRRWDDGSVKHAQISARLPLTQNVAKTLTIRAGTPPTGTALTASDIQAAAPSASIQCGALGTVSLSSLLASPVYTLLSGPQMVEAHYRGAVGTGDLQAWFHVRLYAGGRVWVRAIVENGYLDNGSGAINSGSDQIYVPTISVNGSTVYTRPSVSTISSITTVDDGGGNFHEVVNFSAAHGFDDVGYVNFTGVGGMTGLNGIKGIVSTTSTSLTTKSHAGSYSAFTSGGTVQAVHPANTRYKADGWIGGDPQITPIVEVGYLRSTKQVPNYATAPASSVLTGLDQTYSQGGRGNLTADMSNTGYQPMIGLLPNWCAAFVASGDSRAYNATLANASHLNSYGICYRAKSDHSVARPGVFTTWGLGGTPGPGGGGIGASGITRGGLTWEGAHHPNEDYLAYLLTGDWWYYETACMQAMTYYLCINSNRGSGTSREFDVGQVRCKAWGLRSFGCLASIAPDAQIAGSTFAADARALLSYNYSFLQANITDGVSRTWTGTLYAPEYGSWNSTGSVPAFQWPFMVATNGLLSDLEPLASMAAITAVRDWYYRWPVGLLGQSGVTTDYPFTAAGVYGLTVATTNSSSTWYQTWGDIYQATEGVPNNTASNTLVGGNFPDMTSYWGNFIPAISYAAEDGAAGAAAAYSRLTGASNWATLVAQFQNAPVWAVSPRS